MLRLVAAIGAGIAACTPTRYEYVPPAAGEAQACVASCQATHQQCQSFARLADQQCQSLYQVAMLNFNACQRSRRRGGLCILPQPCAGPATFRCARDFDACFTTCGGEIRSLSPDDRRTKP